ncbi:uncharacterized protein LOC112100053 [Citrus clementina]|uniref:uncharacterized protein LOC112100053 n=1 Tax=Citrus clementina TaxID=85681 RepID=UPI000CED09B9|nr:uncharacterized protein LOC112100053 [Citrus x clementina]
MKFKKVQRSLIIKDKHKENPKTRRTRKGKVKDRLRILRQPETLSSLRKLGILSSLWKLGILGSLQKLGILGSLQKLEIPSRLRLLRRKQFKMTIQILRRMKDLMICNNRLRLTKNCLKKI